MGSMKEKRPGVWRFVVSLGADARTGTYPQATRTFYGTRKEAKKALAELEGEVAGGRVKHSAMTVGELLDRWCKGLSVEPAVAKDYRRIADQRIRPALGEKRLDRVTTRQIDDLLDSLRPELGGSRIARVRTVLNLAFDQARRWKLIRENPVTDAKRISVTRSRVQPPDTSVVPKLLAGAEGDTRRLLVLLATTGARVAELCALRWEDIDRKRRTLTMRRAVAPEGTRIKNMKEEDIRVLSLTDRVLEELGTGEGYIFGGDHWTHPNTMSKRIAGYSRSVGLDVTSRQFRHLVATELLSDGTDAAIVSRRLGHKRVSTTTDIYGHARAELDRPAAEKLDDLLG